MVKAVLLGTLVILGLSTALMLLWNGVVPALFRGPVISWWQALGLLVLIKLLFGRWHRRGGRRPGCTRWKKTFEKKWNTMTPEEQARFKSSFTHQCHRWRWSEPEREEDRQHDGSDRVKVG